MTKPRRTCVVQLVWIRTNARCGRARVRPLSCNVRTGPLFKTSQFASVKTNHFFLMWSHSGKQVSILQCKTRVAAGHEVSEIHSPSFFCPTSAASVRRAVIFPALSGNVPRALATDLCGASNIQLLKKRKHRVQATRGASMVIGTLWTTRGETRGLELRAAQLGRPVATPHLWYPHWTITKSLQNRRAPREKNEGTPKERQESFSNNGFRSRS